MMPIERCVHTRRGIAAVITAATLVVLLGFVSLALDLGYLYNIKTGLQRTADAAAMAAAAKLANFTQENIQQAKDVATEYALMQMNDVMGTDVQISADADVELGRAEFVNGTLQFTVTNEYPNAVRVTVHAEDAADAGISLLFNGRHNPTARLNAQAIAVLVPRDISIVADLSASHTDDSELRHYKDTEINLDEVYEAIHPNSYDAAPATDGAGFTSQITITDLGNGFSEVSVDLTSDGSTSTPALSHLTIGLPDSAVATAAATATSDGGYPVEIVGPDPTTGISGIKFDEAVLGEDGMVETQTFTFQVPSDALIRDAQSITIATKAGRDIGIETHATTAWGRLSYYGDADIPTNYDPTSDDGLWYLPYKQDWSNSELEAMLYNRGYIASEVEALMSDTYDSNGAYRYRTAVALGLADWNSGHPGGRWEAAGASGGNGNNWVGSSELDWKIDYPFNGGSWNEYINSYMRSSWTQMENANPDFRYRYGAKTFTNYLLEWRENHNETPELADAPVQPMQAVKDAVVRLTEVLTELATDDFLALEIYGTTAHHRVDLTADFDEILYGTNGLLNMQAGHFDPRTNMGGGIAKGIEELTGPNARTTSHKVLFVLTDGIANEGPNGENSTTLGKQYARDQVAIAVSEGIRVYTISVGAGADTAFMEELAELGNGEHYHASGTAIEEYSQGLREIFETLGGTRPVVLVK